jgi:TetR/AcrR family transcriptional regulator, fatty acid metabolism regulator protein
MARRSIIEDIRKDQIIESAIDALASVGYTKTTLDQIAEMADFSRGVITYYFKSKDQLITEVMNRILKTQKERIMGRVDSAGSPAEKLAEYIAASIDHMKGDRKHYEAQVELWSNLEYKKEFNQKIYTECIKTVTSILKEGIQAGVFRDMDIQNAAVLIQGSIDGIMIQWVFNECSVKLDSVKDLLVDTIFTLIRRQDSVPG